MTSSALLETYYAVVMVIHKTILKMIKIVPVNVLPVGTELLESIMKYRI